MKYGSCLKVFKGVLSALFLNSATTSKLCSVYFSALFIFQPTAVALICVLVDISTNIESPTVYSFAGGECVNRTHVGNLFLVSRDMCVCLYACLYVCMKLHEVRNYLSLPIASTNMCVFSKLCVFVLSDGVKNDCE